MEQAAAIQVVGLGLSPSDLTAAQLALIQQADTLVGGRRLLERFGEAHGARIVIGGDLEAVLTAIAAHRQAGRQVVVLTSGDPLCHGFGAQLIERFGRQQVRVWPNVSTLATAFARIGAPWHDARLVSLHGQGDLGALYAALRTCEWVAVLTDPERTPAWIAAHLLQRGAEGWRMCVLERLGTPQERLTWLELPEAAARTDTLQPNLVLLHRSGEVKAPHLGLPDEALAHQAGLITKTELRAVALSKLALRPDHCLWDLGAGSGALCIEAGAIVTRGALLALERDPARCAQIRENRRRFAVLNLEVIQAELPEALAGLPAPDRIFIGGGGRKLAQIVKIAAQALKPGGRMLIHTVLLESLATCCQALAGLGWPSEVSQIQVSRSRAMPWGQRLAAENPVWAICGQKPDSNLNINKKIR